MSQWAKYWLGVILLKELWIFMMLVCEWHYSCVDRDILWWWWGRLIVAETLSTVLVGDNHLICFVVWPSNFPYRGVLFIFWNDRRFTSGPSNHACAIVGRPLHLNFWLLGSYSRVLLSCSRGLYFPHISNCNWFSTHYPSLVAQLPFIEHLKGLRLFLNSFNDC